MKHWAAGPAGPHLAACHCRPPPTLPGTVPEEGCPWKRHKERIRFKGQSPLRGQSLWLPVPSTRPHHERGSERHIPQRGGYEITRKSRFLGGDPVAERADTLPALLL